MYDKWHFQLPFRAATGLRRKAVLFADGVAPGDGTSASDNSSNEDDDVLKSKKLQSRAKNKKHSKNSPTPSDSVNSFLGKENSFDFKVSDETNRNDNFEKRSNHNILSQMQFDARDVKLEAELIVPLPPPGSPPLNLPQPTLKNPDKYIVNQLIYFHYNIHTHEMYPSPFSYPTHIPGPPTHTIQSQPVSQPPISYSYKSSNKIPKSSRVSSSKHYHSTHKTTHNSSETNLIVLSNSPLNI